ncbi:unnamed protein product [Notodromas monacha]|uniref:Mitogen-activated protein kinase kinase kinase 1 n=1 Tax=Notodromas monacha TaxID=399045 RepID=A0A7R9GHB7_9CRUS|nr:unnamed protein product [Notodromas monacha]CAG0922611.1 unnamed protein product [Notodromas monacha]
MSTQSRGADYNEDVHPAQNFKSRMRRSSCRSIQQVESLQEPGSSMESADYHSHRMLDAFAKSIKQDSLENFKTRLRKTSGLHQTEKRLPTIVRHPSENLLTYENVSVYADVFLRVNMSSYKTSLSHSFTWSCLVSETVTRICCFPSSQSASKTFGLFDDGCFLLYAQPMCMNPACRRRMPSPCLASCCSLAGDMSTETQRTDVLRKRVRKAQRARFYLLQRAGPHSFVIGGDLPAKNKYKIDIGPQSCSCGHGPYCVHVLFVMLRVFQLTDTDPKLYAKDLKNFEVESLLEKFEKRRANQLRRKKPPDGGTFRNSTAETTLPNQTTSSDEELCAICLLEMVDGEGLTSCRHGCKNQLHFHCIAIWAEECRNRQEQVLCPLCRTPWDETKHDSGSMSMVDVLVSPGLLSSSRSGSCRKKTSWPWKSSKSTNPDLEDCIGSTEDCQSFVSCVGVPLEVRAKANAWSRIFGADLISSLFSRDWSIRAAGLRNLNLHLSRILASGTAAFTTDWIVEAIRTSVGVLMVMASDPVYKVYVGCIRVLRTILSSPFVVDASPEESVARMLQPILNAIILRCADSNQRTSQLSLATLAELGKAGEGQLGEYFGTPGFKAPLEAVLDAVIVDAVPGGAAEWQWTLGRLLALERLVAVFPQDFSIEYVPLKTDTQQGSEGEEDGYILRNFNKIMAVQEVACASVANSHAVVARTARHLFVTAALMCCDEPAAYNEVCAMLATLEPGLRQRLQKKIKPSSSEESGSTSQKLHLRLPLTSKLLTQSSKRLHQFVVTGGKVYRGEETDGSMPREEESCGIGRPPVVRPTHLPLLGHGLGKQKRARWFQFQKTQLTKTVAHGENKQAIPVLDAKAKFKARAPAAVDDESALRFKAELVPLRVNAQLLPALPSWRPKPGLKLQEKADAGANDGAEVVIDYKEGKDWVRGPLLGAGAFSSVYQARDAKTGSIMAVKQVPLRRNSREEERRVENDMKAEIDLMTQLDHENIVRIKFACRDLRVFNIFSEWMPGGSVAALLEKYGAFSDQVIISYTSQVIQGLAYLHDHQVLHRDLKGANLLVDKDGQMVKIADFGTAALLRGARGTVAGELRGQVTGTVAFMAPEVLRGDDYGRKCDVWSVGCCVLEMATAKLPWDELRIANNLALMFKVARTEAPPAVPVTLCESLRDFALRCLEIDPNRRPSAKELLNHPIFDVDASGTSSRNAT